MATAAAKIPLYQAPDGVGHKLLELPQELVDLIESENGPTTLTLTPSPTSALLKTPTKTYSLRQKNTSNGLILLRPVTIQVPAKPSSESESHANGSETSDAGNGEGEGEGDQDGDIPMTTDDDLKDKTVVSLHAFTTLHETIELIPLEEGQEVPVAKARGKWHERFGRTR